MRPMENVVRVPGVVKPHPDRVALVISRTSGKVAQIHAKIGDRVTSPSSSGRRVR